MDNENYDNNLKYLIKLSSESDIEIYDKKLKLKSKDTILKNCEAMKKKELKDIKRHSVLLSNLAKLTNNDNIEQIKLTYSNIEHKINNVHNIEEIIKCLSKIEINKPLKSVRYIRQPNEYIESYAN